MLSTSNMWFGQNTNKKPEVFLPKMIRYISKSSNDGAFPCFEFVEGMTATCSTNGIQTLRLRMAII